MNPHWRDQLNPHFPHLAKATWVTLENLGRRTKVAKLKIAITSIELLSYWGPICFLLTLCRGIAHLTAKQQAPQKSTTMNMLTSLGFSFVYNQKPSSSVHLVTTSSHKLPDQARPPFFLCSRDNIHENVYINFLLRWQCMKQKNSENAQFIFKSHQVSSWSAN